MNTRISLLLSVLYACFILGGCSGGNSTTSAVSTSEATANYPTGTKLGGYSSTNSTGCDSSPLSTSCLQTAYEGMFCQLDPSKYPNLNLNSPECQANIAYIASQAATNYFDLNKKPISNNQLGIASIKFSAINYSTTVPLPNGMQTFQVSGGLAMPEGIDKSKIKGVVAFFHGTQLDNRDVGSYLGADTLLAISVFASQGYIVVLPDYVGQGVDYADVHPYVIYPKASAKTAIDMLAAVKLQIQNQYGYSDQDRLKLFSVGYSEGGAYSLWFNSYINDNPSSLNSFYILTHSVGAEGAYSTSEVTKSFLFSDVSNSPNTFNIQNLWLTNGVKPALFADALISFATYSLNSDYSLFNPDFYALTCGNSLLHSQKKCEINGKKYNLSEALRFPTSTSDGSPAPQILNSAFGKSMGSYKFMETEVMLPSSDKNSAYALLSSMDAGNPDTIIGGKLDTALKAADVNLSSLPNKSVSIITLDQDSVVSPNNYDILLGKYPTKINAAIKIPAVNLQVVSPLPNKTSTPKYMAADHIEANTYQFLYALKIFNQF